MPETPSISASVIASVLSLVITNEALASATSKEEATTFPMNSSEAYSLGIGSIVVVLSKPARVPNVPSLITPTKKYHHLDHFFGTKEFLDGMTNYEIPSVDDAIPSDHSPIILDIDLTSFTNS